MTRAFLGSAAVAALLGTPLAAQITADDVWNSQTAVLTAMGVTPSGTLSRDGSTVTVTGAGGTWGMPMGLGQITWRLGDFTLSEQEDGTVLTGIGEGLALTFDVTVAESPGLSVTGNLRIAAEDFLRRSEGTPGAITTTTSAAALSVDLAELRSPDIGPGTEVTAFFLLEGFDSVVTVTHDGKIAVENRSHTDRLITDVGLAADGFGSRDVGEFLDTGSTMAVTLPQIPLDPMNLGPALRNGLSLQVDASSGQMRSQTVARGFDDEIVSDERQTVGGATQSLWLTAQDGIGFRIGATDIGYKMLNPWLGSGDVGATLDSVGFNLRLPLLAGQGRQTAQLGFDVAGLRLGREVFGLLDLPGEVFDRPGDFGLALRADYEPTVDLTDVMTVGTMLDNGESPLTMFGIALETLVARWDGAELTGTGAAGWDADGEPLTEFMAPPQGEATFDMTGAYAVLDRLAQSGSLPGDALMGARAALAGFGRPVGEDHLRSVISVGAEGFLVNGAPLPF